MGKKWELISEAHERFPLNTRAKWESKEFTLSGQYTFDNDGDIVCKKTGFAVWVYGQWATIVTEPAKEAVKVENEWEFKKLMEYYQSKGWKSIYFTKPLEVADSAFQKNGIWSLEDGFSQTFSEEKGYTIIPFQDFAKREGIETRKPLLTSVDGVELFEGDDYFRVCLLNGKWFKEAYFNLQLESAVITNPDEFKAFSTKQFALDWISKQPVTIQLSDGIATINKSIVCVVVEQHGKSFNLDFDDVHKIGEAVNA